uniref:Tsg C-terminal domain-containing protein n=1 Tax=Romanomermis culicivorax TaxID=13658 RepID=A0A915HLP8_ROMCU
MCISYCSEAIDFFNTSKPALQYSFKTVDVLKSLGASAVRWFYTGCCQCIGQYCIDFGISENLCEHCTDLEE